MCSREGSEQPITFFVPTSLCSQHTRLRCCSSVCYQQLLFHNVPPSHFQEMERCCTFFTVPVMFSDQEKLSEISLPKNVKVQTPSTQTTMMQSRTASVLHFLLKSSGSVQSVLLEWWHLLLSCWHSWQFGGGWVKEASCPWSKHLVITGVSAIGL